MIYQYTRPKKLNGVIDDCIEAVLERRELASPFHPKVPRPYFDEDMTVMDMADRLNGLFQRNAIAITATSVESPHTIHTLNTFTKLFKENADILVKVSGNRGNRYEERVYWGLVQSITMAKESAEIGVPSLKRYPDLEPLPFKWSKLKIGFSTAGMGYIVLH